MLEENQCGKMRLFDARGTVDIFKKMLENPHLTAKGKAQYEGIIAECERLIEENPTDLGLKIDLPRIIDIVVSQAAERSL